MHIPLNVNKNFQDTIMSISSIYEVFGKLPDFFVDYVILWMMAMRSQLSGLMLKFQLSSKRCMFKIFTTIFDKYYYFHITEEKTKLQKE